MAESRDATNKGKTQIQTPNQSCQETHIGLWHPAIILKGIKKRVEAATEVKERKKLTQLVVTVAA